MEYRAVVKRKDSSNELAHYKYLKREKVNGKWRYYYDDLTTNDDKKNAYLETKRIYESSIKELADRQKVQGVLPNDRIQDSYRKTIDQYADYSKQAKEEYLKTLVGTTVCLKRNVNAGKTSVDEILQKSKSRKITNTANVKKAVKKTSVKDLDDKTRNRLRTAHTLVELK